MTGRRGMINPDYLYNKGSGFQLTAEGVSKVTEHATLGGTMSELATLFGCDSSTLSKWRDKNGQNYNEEFDRAWAAGEYAFKMGLREAQAQLAAVNASMAIHMGKQYLGQDDKPQEHVHTHRVIGTMPDYDMAPEEWKEKFAPSGIDQIDYARRVEAAVEDAEIVEDD